MSAQTAEPAKLTLPEALRERIGQAAREGHPHEVCGVLIGRFDGAHVNVAQIAEARNIAAERRHDRYELDPRDFLAADRAARAAGLEVVGFWHSHPNGTAQPSEVDRAQAWPHYAYLIVGITPGGVTGVRAWCLHAGHFVELAIEASPG